MYDEQTRVWHPRSFWMFGGIMLVLTIGQIPLALGRVAGKSPKQFLFWLNISAIAFWLICFILLIVRYRARPFVAVGPNGVTYKTDLVRVNTVPWDEVEGVHLGPPHKRKRVQLKTSGRNKSIDLSNLIGLEGQAIELHGCVAERLASMARTSATRNEN